MRDLNKKLARGFTLIEIMVSISVFAMVMLFVSSSIYGVFDSNRKSQSLRAVMDNLNLSLEAMTRNIRFGYNYHCDISQGTVTDPRDCSSGASSIQLYDQNGATVVYQLCTTGANAGRIAKSASCVNGPFVTGTDVTIATTTFRVRGSAPYVSGAGNCPGANNCEQPRVIVVISGYSGTKATSRSSFTLQTTISQRIFDAE